VCDVQHNPFKALVVVALAASVIATGGADAAFVELTITVEESSAASTFFATADTVSYYASQVSAIGDAVQCVSTLSAGDCSAAALSFATMGTLQVAKGAVEVTTQQGMKAVSTTLGNGSTVLDIGVAVAKKPEPAKKADPPKKQSTPAKTQSSKKK